MATTTNYGWDTPDDTDLVKDGASAIRTLGSSIDTTTKNLNPQTTTGALAFRSATANVNTALPIGTAGQVLTVASGLPSWATPSDQTPLTTKGDVFTFSTVDARLGVGANGTVLTADSAEATGLKWAAPASASASGCSITKITTAQTLSNATDTAISFNSENFDTDGYHDNATNNTRITIPAGKGGKYIATGGIAYTSNATGVRQIYIRKNGTTAVANFNSNAVSGDATYSEVSGIIDLVATDYLELMGWQTSGGNLNVLALTSTNFAVALIGA